MKLLRILFTLLTLTVMLAGCEKEAPIELGTITGTVTDGITTEPLKGVVVSIAPTGKSMTTGSDGKFEFPEINDGQYTVSVSKENYKSDSKSVNVQSGTTVVDFAIMTGNGAVSLSTQTLDFGKNNHTLVFDIENIGKSSLTYNVESEKYKWLSASPKSATIDSKRKKSITVTIDRAKIDEDKNITLPISSNAGSGNINIRVTHDVATAAMKLSKSELDFGDNLSQLSFDVQNEGNADLEYNISTGSENWLSVSPATATISENGTKTVTVNIDRKNLTENKQYTLVVSSNVGSKEILIKVTKAISAGILKVSTSTLAFGENLDELTFTISNTGTAAFDFNLYGSYPWVSGHPTGGTVQPSSVTTVKIYVDRTKIFGKVSGILTVKTTDGQEHEITMSAYEPLNYGTATSSHRDFSVEISDVYTQGSDYYIEFKGTYIGSTECNNVRMYGDYAGSRSSAIDNEGNIYSNHQLYIGDETYYTWGGIDIPRLTYGDVFRKEIKIKNVDVNATKFTTISIEFAKNGVSSGEGVFTFKNVPIIR